MSTPVIRQSPTTVKEPQLIDVLNLFKKQLLLGLNCHHIGTIQSFDAENQTVTVTVNYKKTFFQFNATTGEYTSRLEDYSLLTEVPVVILHGGSAYLNLPIAAGDQCLLLFNDRDFSNWFAGSSTSANQSPRLHAFSDALAIVGPNNLNSLIADFDEVRAMLTDGSVKNGINPSNSKLVLENATNSLNDLLQNLATQLENLCTAIAAITVTGVTTGPGVSGPPANAASFATISAQISTIATQIGGLIE